MQHTDYKGISFLEYHPHLNILCIIHLFITLQTVLNIVLGTRDGWQEVFEKSILKFIFTIQKDTYYFNKAILII